jgi:hypothetical protein
MRTKLLNVIVLMVALLSACVPSPVEITQPTDVNSPPEPTYTPVAIIPSDTPTTVVPSETPDQEVLTQVVMLVQSADHIFHMVSPLIPLGSNYSPAFSGLNTRGSAIDGTAYVYDFTTFPTVMVVDENESIQQDFIQNPTHGLAVWRNAEGTQSLLAWGTQLIVPNTPSSLQISAPDGSQLETLYTQEVSVPPMQLVAQYWSADGKSLYFSREPSGLGGYIVFPGASSLYKIDIGSKQITELIPANFPSEAYSCLDAISGDSLYVADHCSQNVITVHDLESGATTTIKPPDGLSGYRVLGSARFSPDGSRLAFALAKSDPSDEQGWVAVSDGIQGSSNLVLTASTGVYYTVVGWLDDQTLLIQSNPISGCEGCENQLWTVNVDGSNLALVADGSFVTVMDNK